MRGNFEYLQNIYKGEGFFTMTVYYTPSGEICLQGKGLTFKIFYILAYWNLLRIWKRKKRKLMDLTPNDNLR